MSASDTQKLPEELIGVCKTIGMIGPPYQVVGPSPNGTGPALARIILLESGKEVDYPVEDLRRKRF